MANYIPDRQERLILAELVKNPRISDNSISRATGIAIKTVNRKRKLMEERGLVQYICRIVHGPPGTGEYAGRAILVVQFAPGIYRQRFLQRYTEQNFLSGYRKHISCMWLAEMEGMLCLAILLESRKASDIIEIFNAELCRRLEENFGSACVKRCIHLPLAADLVYFNNYEQVSGMQNAYVRSGQPVFVGGE